MARWRSGYAEVCKTFQTSSTLVRASNVNKKDSMQKDPQQIENIEKKIPENTQPAQPPRDHEIFITIRRVTAWVMIMSAILFALVGVLAIWEVLGESAGDVVWRAFSSLAIIAFAALVVNVASKAMMSKQ